MPELEGEDGRRHTWSENDYVELHDDNEVRELRMRQKGEKVREMEEGSLNVLKSSRRGCCRASSLGGLGSWWDEMEGSQLPAPSGSGVISSPKGLRG